ncbi:MAG: hypothetical protein PHX25_00260 [Candidatus Pacebacteria bacterium]|nr:hypothetical protein [Candidatus Paceibacterota bacterium]
MFQNIVYFVVLFLLVSFLSQMIAATIVTRISKNIPFEWNSLGEINDILKSKKIARDVWFISIPISFKELRHQWNLSFNKNSSVYFLFFFNMRLIIILDILRERGFVTRRKIDVFDYEKFGNLLNKIQDADGLSDCLKEGYSIVKDMENTGMKVDLFEYKQICCGQKRKFLFPSLIFAKIKI